MDNHVHLLINEGEEEISRIMKKINTSYVYYFNKKYKRVGHLFQDRYKSEPIESEEYLLAAARYIHNNPVKAGIVKDASHYKWSSFTLYLDKNKCKGNEIERSTILGIFSADDDKAIRLLVEYTKQAIDDHFIECKEDENKNNLNIEKVVTYIDEFLRERGQTKESLKYRQNMGIRNQLVRELKEKSNLSIRQIADLLGINKNMVQRAK